MYWSATYRTDRDPCTIENGCVTSNFPKGKLQADGNLVLYNNASQSIWSSKTKGDNVILKMHNDGHVHMTKRDSNNVQIEIWSLIIPSAPAQRTTLSPTKNPVQTPALAEIPPTGTPAKNSQMLTHEPSIQTRILPTYLPVAAPSLKPKPPSVTLEPILVPTCSITTISDPLIASKLGCDGSYFSKYPSSLPTTTRGIITDSITKRSCDDLSYDEGEEDENNSNLVNQKNNREVVLETKVEFLYKAHTNVSLSNLINKERDGILIAVERTILESVSTLLECFNTNINGYSGRHRQKRRGLRKLAIVDIDSLPSDSIIDVDGCLPIAPAVSCVVVNADLTLGLDDSSADAIEAARKSVLSLIKENMIKGTYISPSIPQLTDLRFLEDHDYYGSTFIPAGGKTDTTAPKISFYFPFVFLLCVGAILIPILLFIRRKRAFFRQSPLRYVPQIDYQSDTSRKKAPPSLPIPTNTPNIPYQHDSKLIKDRIATSINQNNNTNKLEQYPNTSQVNINSLPLAPTLLLPAAVNKSLRSLGYFDEDSSTSRSGVSHNMNACQDMECEICARHKRIRFILSQTTDNVVV